MKLPILLIFLSVNLKKTTSLIPFTTGTTNGYIVALSYPLGSPESNVFMSYNFEANYALPTKSSDFTQGLYDKIFFINGVNRNETTARMNAMNFFSRRQVYNMIEDKMEDYGINGKDCLLRIICEVAGVDLMSINGVLGSIVHVLLTPSTSSSEQAMQDYLDAENSRKNCSAYHNNCKLKLLDSFSK